jgi:KDO2-lipid IV(A) lauroyltransferase
MFMYRCLGRLPLSLLYPVAWCVYLFFYYVSGYRKAVVTENLANAFPDKSATEITFLAKKFYRRLAQTAVEIARARYMPRDAFRQRVQVVNPQLLVECSEEMTRTVIILTIHQGNWEWMLHGVSTELGMPLDPVYKPLHSPTADRFMREVRARFGARPVPMKMAPRDILGNRNRFRLVAMVADQSPIRGERSYWTTFLGREAAFYQGAEGIARALGSAVVFAQCRRLRRGHYQVRFHKLGEPPYQSPEGELTERYVRIAERAIREEPESWLWSNRRWKRQRDGGPGA